MITSFRNPLVKGIKRLKQKKYRRQEGLFFAEGLRVVMAAVDAGATIETLVYCSDLLTSEKARRMVEEQQKAGLRCVEVSANVFRAISDRDNPVGLGAIVAATLIDLEELVARPDDILVALIEVAEPGNLGTVLRTMDAVGAAGLIVVGQAVDPFHPTAVKASMGSVFTVPICQIRDENALMAWARSRGLHTIATSARAGQSFREVDYRFPALLLLGSERLGLPVQMIEAAEHSVAIPMYGSASSLNLAVAAGVLLYELRRST